MSEVYCLPLILPMLSLLAMGLMPPGWPNRRPKIVGKTVTNAAGLHLIASAIGLGLTISRGPIDWPPLLLDGTSAVMMTLVAFVSWNICRFSIRHLDGNPQQGRFFCWTALTIGSVSLLVMTGNLLVLLAGWGLASLGTHRLLLHFSDRRAAQRAAWTKFAISRMGDVLLLVAVAVVYRRFGTFELAELFAVAGSATGDVAALKVFAALMVAGTILKSAQFPFHTWLPDTMEAPTPVSALMHAGIVNAGGYVLIRTSPLLVHATAAMSWLAVSGAVTACFGAVVMLTQTSVKRSLAFSTISQMGFMMLQCGLGAFSAAMLHIIAHSLYKAHAFLGSGGVLRQPHNNLASLLPTRDFGRSAGTFAGCAVVTASIFLGVAWLFDMQPAAKPGSFLLGSVLCLGLTRWMWLLAASGNRRLVLTALATTTVLCVAYVTGFLAVDHVIAAAAVPKPFGLTTFAAGLVAAIGFGGLLLLEHALAAEKPPNWLNKLYVHASNGFYIDALVQRLAAAALS
ncbi:MAG: proton-conducting transporter membrane subunit [Planctomycetaceae bacterium]